MVAAEEVARIGTQKARHELLENILRRVDARKGTKFARAPVTTRLDWHEPVREAVKAIDFAALRQETMKRADERSLQTKLALKLIDIGYKTYRIDERA
jgi:hypothetical protein